MTIFELIHEEVTARQVARLYGMRFDRSGRGFCPWHDDGKHAALKFFDDGSHCYCHACHQYGDTVSLAAQMLGITDIEAAERIKADFHLDQPVDRRPDPSTMARRRRKRDEEAERKAAINKRWGYLCDVVHEADARLSTYTPETIDAEFDVILSARCKADLELNLLWEDMRSGRA